MVLLKIPDFKSVSKRQLASLLNVSGIHYLEILGANFEASP
jgi:hypothetical protein